MAIDVSKITFPIKIKWTHPAVPPISIIVGKVYEAIEKNETTFIVNNIEFELDVFEQVFDEEIEK